MASLLTAIQYRPVQNQSQNTQTATVVQTTSVKTENPTNDKKVKVAALTGSIVTTLLYLFALAKQVYSVRTI